MRKTIRERHPTRVIAAAVTALALALAGVAVAKDANDDGIPDRWEKRNDLSLKVDQSKRDQDRDSLKNLGEYRSHTDPRDADSDDDGIEDGDDDGPGHDQGDDHGQDSGSHDVNDDHGQS